MNVPGLLACTKVETSALLFINWNIHSMLSNLCTLSTIYKVKHINRSYTFDLFLESYVSFQFSFSFIYFRLGYSIYIVYVTNRNKITNKRRKRKKLMVLVEVCGGQRSLTFELTTSRCTCSCCIGKAEFVMIFVHKSFSMLFHNPHFLFQTQG